MTNVCSIRDLSVMYLPKLYFPIPFYLMFPSERKRNRSRQGAVVPSGVDNYPVDQSDQQQQDDGHEDQKYYVKIVFHLRFMFFVGAKVVRICRLFKIIVRVHVPIGLSACPDWANSPFQHTVTAI